MHSMGAHVADDLRMVIVPCPNDLIMDLLPVPVYELGYLRQMICR